MISDYAISDYFSFKGSVTNLNEIYHNYDYLIHPSHGETFCYTVVESLLSNLPVITTQKGGNVLGLIYPYQNGFLYETKNAIELKTLLSKILNEEISIQNFLAENEMLKKLTLEEMVNNYFKFLI
jgi:glycosyltransferase involved in cell wall biosynthesis